MAVAEGVRLAVGELLLVTDAVALELGVLLGVLEDEGVIDAVAETDDVDEMDPPLERVAVEDGVDVPLLLAVMLAVSELVDELVAEEVAVEDGVWEGTVHSVPGATALPVQFTLSVSW